MRLTELLIPFDSKVEKIQGKVKCIGTEIGKIHSYPMIPMGEGFVWDSVNSIVTQHL